MHGELVECVVSKLPDAPFSKFLKESLSFDWLQEGDDRLGITRFEQGHNELVRCRRLKLNPGKIVILLNPVLNEDKRLMKHTIVHELLHAIGLIEHDEEHEELVKEIAPAPSLKESELLQRLQKESLARLQRKEWHCKYCDHRWQRKTVSKVTRCPNCARPQ